MARPLWVDNIIKKTFPQRFLAARLTRVPGLGRLMERWLFEGDELIVLPRERTIRVDQAVADLDQTVLPSQVVEHFINEANYHFLMHTCICREAEGCRDYPIELGCLFLGEAALGINPRLGRRVTKEEALDHARKCREAGLVHLIGRGKLDTVRFNVGPGEKLLTICNCCPCCCLWKILPLVSGAISEKVHRMPGVRVWVNENCTGCGQCASDTCFVSAITMDGSRAMIGEACRACGRCVSVCRESAITLSFEAQHPVQDSIARLAPLVNIK